MGHVRSGGREPADDEARVVRAVESRFGLKLHRGLHSLLISAARKQVELGAVRDLRELAWRVTSLLPSDPVAQAMREAASIQETYFFRAPEQLESLAAAVRERLLPHKRERKLKVWSAACATGEEAYTLALLFRRAVPDVQVSVVGTDMNEKAIRWAKRGRYGARSFRRVRAESFKGAFQQRGEAWEVCDELRRSVSFEVLNLVTDRYPNEVVGQFDVVVCRNVLIYIDSSRLPALMSRLSESALGTCLLALTPVEHAAAQYLNGFTELGQGLYFRERPKAAKRPVAAVPASSPVRKHGPEPAKPASAARRSSPVDVSGLLQKAREAADRQQLALAKELLREAVTIDPNRAETFHLLGVVLLSEGDAGAAIAELRRALYLNRELVAAQLSLAQALARDGRAAEARPHFARALKLLEGLPDPERLPHSDLTAGAARSIAALGLERGQRR